MEVRLPSTFGMITATSAAIIFGAYSWDVRSGMIAFGAGLWFGFILGLIVFNIRIEPYQREIPLTRPQPTGDGRFMSITNTGGGMVGEFEKSPIREGQEVAIARKIVKGVPFSHALAGPGKIVTRDQYEAYRDLIISKGWLRLRSPNNPQGGYVVTELGMQNFNRIAMYPYPAHGRGVTVARKLSGSTHTHT